MRSAYVELKSERVYAPAARLKTAQDQLAALQNVTTNAHSTTWTVCQEHHAPARDVCGKAKVICRGLHSSTSQLNLSRAGRKTTP